MKKLRFLFSAVIVVSALFLLGGSAFGLSINVYDPAAVGGLTILEDFENCGAGWYQSLDTEVGTFTAGGTAGTGDTSYNSDPVNTDSALPYFSIQDSGPWYGRTNTTDGGSQWLDSGDITELTLTLDQDLGLNSLFFYLMDPSDCGATTTITGETSVTASIDFSNLSNGIAYLVGIKWDEGETLTQIKWSVSNTADGFGLDDFATTSPVPEPTTMALLGFGLLGLAGVYRKKK